MVTCFFTPPKLMRKAVIDIFGDKQSYIAYHQLALIDFNESKKYLIAG